MAKFKYYDGTNWVEIAPTASPTFSGTVNVSGATLKVKTIQAPTSSGGSTYGAGTSGKALMTNGSTVYWGSPSATVSAATTSAIGGFKAHSVVSSATEYTEMDQYRASYVIINSSNNKAFVRVPLQIYDYVTLEGNSYEVHFQIPKTHHYIPFSDYNGLVDLLIGMGFDGASNGRIMPATGYALYSNNDGAWVIGMYGRKSGNSRYLYLAICVYNGGVYRTEYHISSNNISMDGVTLAVEPNNNYSNLSS